IATIEVLSQSFGEAAAFANLLKAQLMTLAEHTGGSTAAARAEAEAISASTTAKRVGAAATLEAAGAEDKLTYSSYKSFVSSRALASEAGLGGVGYALSRVASQSKMLGPILEAALPIALFFGAIDVIESMATSVKKVYDNFVLLKDRSE